MALSQTPHVAWLSCSLKPLPPESVKASSMWINCQVHCQLEIDLRPTLLHCRCLLWVEAIVYGQAALRLSPLTSWGLSWVEFSWDQPSYCSVQSRRPLFHSLILLNNHSLSFRTSLSCDIKLPNVLFLSKLYIGFFLSAPFVLFHCRPT